MDEKLFDAWTRRRFGVGASGLGAALLGLARLEDADSESKHIHKDKDKDKHKHHHNHKHHHKHKGKHKGPKCKKAGTGGCSTSRPDCCSGLLCQVVPGFGGVRCCANVGASCSRADQCCSGTCVHGACAPLS